MSTSLSLPAHRRITSCVSQLHSEQDVQKIREHKITRLTATLAKGKKYDDNDDQRLEQPVP